MKYLILMFSLLFGNNLHVYIDGNETTMKVPTGEYKFVETSIGQYHELESRIE